MYTKSDNARQKAMIGVWCGPCKACAPSPFHRTRLWSLLVCCSEKTTIGVWWGPISTPLLFLNPPLSCWGRLLNRHIYIKQYKTKHRLVFDRCASYILSLKIYTFLEEKNTEQLLFFNKLCYLDLFLLLRRGLPI